MDSRPDDLVLSSWRQQEAVRPLVRELERQGLIRSVEVAALVESGVPGDAIGEWAATVRARDQEGVLVAAGEPVWLAIALVALSWHYPDMPVRDASRWAVMCDRLGVELFETVSAWSEVDAVCGWAHQAAGMSPGEVADRAGRPGAIQVEATLAMAALRGVRVPAHWLPAGSVLGRRAESAAR